ncbi:hypothetical protein SOVF_013980 [Spinacia oleracea]|nr:hypothetical protein SOVF_013980 [Spinacia oleracea]
MYGDGYWDTLYPVRAISNHPVLSKSLKNQPLDLNFVSLFRNKPEEIRVVASCHDLLLCSHIGLYYVVNLLTRCWIEVPPPPTHNQDLGPTLLELCTSPKAGLFCSHDQRDISNGDGLCRFKVIVLPAVRSDLILNPYPNFNIPPQLYASQFSVQIFSSESRQWVDISVDWYPLSLNAYLNFTPILFHENMLHWLNGRSLVSLDAHINLSHSVDLPKELSLEHPCVFGVCQGQFRVARLIYEETDGHVLLVWDLVDYHKGVWQLAHRVLLHQASLKKYNYNFRLMAFHPYDGDRVYVNIRNDVFQFNLRTGILESYYRLNLNRRFHTFETPLPLLLHHRGLPTALPP